MENIFCLAALVYVRDKKILVCKKKNHTIWQLPGGKKNENESYEECVRREVKEEIDVELTAIRSMGVIEGDSTYAGKSVHMEIYQTDEDITPVPRGEIEKVAWFSVEQAKKLGTQTLQTNAEEWIGL